jgi:AraC family transcriptional regulator
MNKKSAYIARINSAIDYIDENLANTISLKELANAANFSKFHFNRIFSSIMGETPFQFILRLRLEKAASLILSNQQEPISNIAMQCGFANLSVFSRNFKKRFHLSATAYRKTYTQNSNISQVVSNLQQKEGRDALYICPRLQTIKWMTNMDFNKGVEVKNLPKMTLAYVRNIGPWEGDKQMYERLRKQLFAWAEEKGVLFREGFKYLILYHDDPNVTTGKNLRMSLCITIPPDIKVEGDIGKMEIDAAKYAIARFELTEKDFQKAWEWLYGQWLPNSGYQPDDKPYFETYPAPPQNGLFTVDYCIPIKRI